MKCYMCPRECGSDRERGELGFCKSPESFSVAKIMLHKWEEPCISADGGAGAVFFFGCNLRCAYCQNRKISGGVGNGDAAGIMTDDRLEREIFGLIDKGAECIEFVTPTHYTERLVRLIERIKPRLSVPVVWNSGGYEKTSALKMLDGLVDIYLPDFKYFDDEIAKKYSSAPNYRETAADALAEMIKQVGKPHFGEKGKLLSGVVVRHLVLPSHRADSMAILRFIAERFGTESLLLSLMSQYTPDFYIENNECKYKNLCRRLTRFEYDSVMKLAEELEFDGYFQSFASADKSFTPEF